MTEVVRIVVQEVNSGGDEGAVARHATRALKREGREREERERKVS